MEMRPMRLRPMLRRRKSKVFPVSSWLMKSSKVSLSPLSLVFVEFLFAFFFYGGAPSFSVLQFSFFHFSSALIDFFFPRTVSKNSLKKRKVTQNEYRSFINYHISFSNELFSVSNTFLAGHQVKIIKFYSRVCARRNRRRNSREFFSRARLRSRELMRTER